jgi:hypothetical protein
MLGCLNNKKILVVVLYILYYVFMCSGSVTFCTDPDPVADPDLRIRTFD